MEGLKDKVIVFAGAGEIADGVAKFLGAGGAKIVRNNFVQHTLYEVIRWLEANHEGLTGVVKELPTREQIDVPVDEMLIVELYSK